MAIVTPEADREAIYRRLYRAWPEWTVVGELPDGECHALWREGRLQQRMHPDGLGLSLFRVRMGIA